MPKYLISQIIQIKNLHQTKYNLYLHEIENTYNKSSTSMDLQIPYEIQFANGNHIYGRINCKTGEEISSIKKKIIDFEGIKNENSFKLSKTNLTQNQKVNSQTQRITFKEEKQNNFGSVISVRSRKMSEDSMFEQTSLIVEENGYQNFIETQPQIPPRVCGYVTFPNSIFFCFSSRKYLVLDTQYLRFYNSQQSQHTFKQIKSQEIQEIKSYKRKHFYCIRLLLPSDEINMKFINKDICKQWVGYLNQVLNFSLYLKQKQAFSKKESFQKYLDTFLKSNKNLDSTNIVKLQDQMETIVFSVHSNIPCESLIKNKSTMILKLMSFEITHKVDSGSFSTIYLARKKGRDMALKQMSKDKLLYKGQMKYALTELNVLVKSRNCPYIIPLYYAFQTHDYIYLALKYIPYGNLGRLIQKRRKIEESQAIQIIIELIFAIEFLHDQKILYRDLKPENILLDREGHIYLTDFGLAKELDQEEEAHSFLGTPLYLAPERFMDNGRGVDYRSDIYAVGIILFQLLHGYHPFSADNFNSVVYNIRNTEVEVDENLSPLVKKFLSQTLEKNPSKRCSKMSEHLLFKRVDWKKIGRKQQEGIQVFEESSKPMAQINYEIDEDYNEENYPDKKIVGWNYNYEEEN